MAYDQNKVHTLYKKLLTFYPRGLRERLGESMEQTFHDLCNEQKHQPTRQFFVLSVFIETAIVIYGGLLLLPVAFALNLRPMLKRERPEGKRRLYTINVVVGVIILLLITVTWGTLLVEEIYCLRGIRCD